MTRKQRIAASVLIVAVGAATSATMLGTDGDDDGQDAPASASTVDDVAPLDLPPGTIAAHQGRYAPEDPQVMVTVGEAVVFENLDDVPHTFTADDGLFDSGIVSPGGEYEIRLDGPRTVAFHCEIHPAMRGEFRIG